jgi:hypothetical protein
MGIYTVRVREVIPTGTIPPKKNPRKRFEKIKNKKKKSWKKQEKSARKSGTNLESEQISTTKYFIL